MQGKAGDGHRIGISEGGFMNRTTIIRDVFKRVGIKNDMDISRETGMDYNRLHKRRMKHIGSMRLDELWLLQRHAHFTDEELLQLIKEGKNEE